MMAETDLSKISYNTYTSNKIQIYTIARGIPKTQGHAKVIKEIPVN